MEQVAEIIQGGSVAQAVAASRAGDVEDLRAWLKSGGNPNQYDAEGWTPLLAAAVRGHADAVDLLLNNPVTPADPGIAHAVSGALPIHMAGHSGSVAVSDQLLAARPELLEVAWLINGHTLLLQAVFYGHLDLTRFALGRGANTAATTLRGLGPMELAQQFQNQPMIAVLQPYDSPREAKSSYFQALLQRITPTTPPEEMGAQRLADEFVATIEQGLSQTAGSKGAIETTLGHVRDLVENRNADVNRLGGVLRQPPLIVIVTGNNGSPANENVAELRQRLAEYLLDNGADPAVKEYHPMGVGSIIRAAVFNHLDILKMMGRHMKAEELTAELNEKPIVNGLTALHDSVLRASMAGPDRIEGYLAQIRWAVASGARSDIEDFSGRTQKSIAESVTDPERRALLLQALGIEIGRGAKQA